MRDRYELYVLARELGQVRRAPVERQWCTALRLPTGMRFESSLVTKGVKMVRQHRHECDAVTRPKNIRVCCNAGSIPATSTNREMADMQFMACPTQNAGKP